MFKSTGLRRNLSIYAKKKFIGSRHKAHAARSLIDIIHQKNQNYRHIIDDGLK